MKVYITKKSQSDKHYHTDTSCVCIPETYIEREKSQVEATADPCSVCVMNGNQKIHKTKHPHKPCPYCGETVGNLPAHLPCNEVPSLDD